MPIPLAPGGKFYFPNIVFRLVRSNLPPHQVVFRCPQQLNKIDIKNYLSSLYNVTATDIRTMNYTGHALRLRHQSHGLSQRLNNAKQLQASYKKVIVTMDEDFVFPDPPGVKSHGATRMPPRMKRGRNSANAVRSQINQQALERGVDLNAKQTL